MHSFLFIAVGLVSALSMRATVISALCLGERLLSVLKQRHGQPKCGKLRYCESTSCHQTTPTDLFGPCFPSAPQFKHSSSGLFKVVRLRIIRARLRFQRYRRNIGSKRSERFSRLLPGQLTFSTRPSCARTEISKLRERIS